MKTKHLIPLNTPIYKVIPLQHSICLITGNQFITVDIPTGIQTIYTINESDLLLDLHYTKDLVYLAGIGHPPLIYNTAEKRLLKTATINHENKPGYSAIIKIADRLYCANIHSEELEIRTPDNILIRSFKVGNFIKELIWEEHSRTLIIAAAESEDSGYLLFYHLDEQNEIHCLDVYVDCHFSVSHVDFNIDRSELFITGGFPPLNIQVHAYPNLNFKKEIMLSEDYLKDKFGNDFGYAYHQRHQLLNENEWLFPYSGGSIMHINYTTNDYRILLETGETWIFIQFIGDELIGVTAEGNIHFFEHDFTKPVTPSIKIARPPYKEIDNEQPLFKRYTIDPKDEPEELNLL